MVPKGQLARHMQQETHLSWSMSARPSSSERMAFTPQARAQGRSMRKMALYWHTPMQRPHLTHLS